MQFLNLFIKSTETTEKQKAKLEAIKTEEKFPKVLFIACSAITILLRPQWFIIGAAAGAFIQHKYSDHKFVKIINPDKRIIPLFDIAVSCIGAVSSILSYTYPASIVQILPILGGLAAGRSLYRIYDHLQVKKEQ